MDSSLETTADNSSNEDEFRSCWCCGTKMNLDVCQECHCTFCIKCARKTYVHWCMHIHPTNKDPYFKSKKTCCEVNLCALF